MCLLLKFSRSFNPTLWYISQQKFQLHVVCLFWSDSLSQRNTQKLASCLRVAASHVMGGDNSCWHAATLSSNDSSNRLKKKKFQVTTEIHQPPNKCEHTAPAKQSATSSQVRTTASKGLAKSFLSCKWRIKEFFFKAASLLVVCSNSCKNYHILRFSNIGISLKNTASVRM